MVQWEIRVAFGFSKVKNKFLVFNTFKIKLINCFFFSEIKIIHGRRVIGTTNRAIVSFYHVNVQFALLEYITMHSRQRFAGVNSTDATGTLFLRTL